MIGSSNSLVIFPELDDLSKNLASKFERLEGIIIALINQQKKMQIELRGIKAKYEALVDIVLKLMKKDK